MKPMGVSKREKKKKEIGSETEKSDRLDTPQTRVSFSARKVAATERWVVNDNLPCTLG